MGCPIVGPEPVVENVRRNLEAVCELGFFFRYVVAIQAVEMDEPVTTTVRSSSQAKWLWF